MTFTDAQYPNVGIGEQRVSLFLSDGLVAEDCSWAGANLHSKKPKWAHLVCPQE